MIASHQRWARDDRSGGNMTWRRRRDMRPGDMLIHRTPDVHWRGWHCAGRSTLLVVVDGRREIGFWDASDWVIGEICPSGLFEVPT